MIPDSATGTRILHREATCDVGPQDEVARFLRIAVQRCVRNAAGQHTPRNQFERYVMDRLNKPENGSEAWYGDIPQLADDICRSIRCKWPLRDATSRGQV